MEEGTRSRLLGRLGKATTGKSCVYINKLDDIDVEVLKEMIAQTIQFVNGAYPDVAAGDAPV